MPVSNDPITRRLAGERPTAPETVQAPAAPDVVWIRATAEVNVAGVDPVIDYVSIPRAEWDAMTEQQREDEIQQAAVGALEQLASSGASVVDVDEVPAEHRG